MRARGPRHRDDDGVARYRSDVLFGRARDGRLGWVATARRENASRDISRHLNVGGQRRFALFSRGGGFPLTRARRLKNCWAPAAHVVDRQQRTRNTSDRNRTTFVSKKYFFKHTFYPLKNKSNAFVWSDDFHLKTILCTHVDKQVGKRQGRACFQRLRRSRFLRFVRVFVVRVRFSRTRDDARSHL